MKPNIISSSDSFDNINSGDEITLEQREQAVLVMAAVGTQRRSIHNVPDTTTIPSNESHGTAVPSERVPANPLLIPTETSLPLSERATVAAGPHRRRRLGKELIIMFARTLVKRLERVDSTMHRDAREVIRHCAQQNRNGNPAFASLIKSFQMNLKELVGHTNWNKAKEDLSRSLARQIMRRSHLSFHDARKKAAGMARLAANQYTVDEL